MRSKFVWALFDLSGNLLVHEGKVTTFLSREEARNFKKTHNLQASVKKLANVALAKSEVLSALPKAEKKQKTYVVLVVDESGSMWGLEDSVKQYFEQQVSEIRKTSDSQEVLVSLLKFNGLVNPVFWHKPSTEELKLTYWAHGSTALYDAIWVAIHGVLSQDDVNDPDVAVLVVTMTDGDENSSKSVNGAELGNKIRELKSTGKWTFTFLGTTETSIYSALDLGIDLGNTGQFVASVKGMAQATQRSTQSLNKYFQQRSVGSTQSLSYYDNDESK